MGIIASGMNLGISIGSITWSPLRKWSQVVTALKTKRIKQANPPKMEEKIFSGTWTYSRNHNVYGYVLIFFKAADCTHKGGIDQDITGEIYCPYRWTIDNVSEENLIRNDYGDGG